MRAAAVYLLLLASSSALLLASPAGAASRSLSQEGITQDALPGLPNLPAALPAAAAGDPTAPQTASTAAVNPAQNGINVDVLVYVEKANCADVQDRVNVTVNTWVKRVLVFVNVDTTTCAASAQSQGTVIVTVRVKVPVPTFGVDVSVITNSIGNSLGRNLKVADLAKRNKEIKQLVDWADKKGYKVAKVEVKVTA